jgi:hypothetical protein|nr:MAG TPA: hypothetical protein [Caudoviricetes sp.]
MKKKIGNSMRIPKSFRGQIVDVKPYHEEGRTVWTFWLFGEKWIAFENWIFDENWKGD